MDSLLQSKLLPGLVAKGWEPLFKSTENKHPTDAMKLKYQGNRNTTCFLLMFLIGLFSVQLFIIWTIRVKKWFVLSTVQLAIYIKML